MGTWRNTTNFWNDAHWRDAAHKIKEILEQGKELPSGVCFKDRFIAVGPVDPVGDEVVGPAGPTLRPEWTSLPT